MKMHVVSTLLYLSLDTKKKEKSIQRIQETTLVV